MESKLCRCLKILAALFANGFTSYWLVRGWQDPEVIGFVKDIAGHNEQPGTWIIQATGFSILAVIHLSILVLLEQKLIDHGK